MGGILFPMGVPEGRAPSLRAIMDEADKSDRRFGDFASMHEAYGILAEEVAELFDAVRMPTGNPTGFVYHDEPPSLTQMRVARIRAEAIQVAAVALRIAEQADRVTR